MSVERCVTILQEVIIFFVLLQFNSIQFNPVQFTRCPPENEFNSPFSNKKTRVCYVTLLCYICIFSSFHFLPIFLFFFSSSIHSLLLSFVKCFGFFILFVWGTGTGMGGRCGTMG